MSLPERLSYLYNAADFADDAREFSGATEIDFHEWWHEPLPPKIILKTIGGCALRPLCNFVMTDTDWSRYDVRPRSVDQDSGIILFNQIPATNTPEPFTVSETEPPRMIAHGDVRIVFNKAV